MSASSPAYVFTPRWKEELVCSSGGRSFVLEMTMGRINIYLPPRGQWPELAPDWAKDDWDALHAQLEAWCASRNYPLTVDPSATVSFPAGG